MAPPKTSKRRKTNPLRLNFKRLLAFGALLLLPGASLYTWHRFADAPTQEKIEAFTLNIIDVVRESDGAPKELVFWLDLAADRIPLLQGKVVAPGTAVDAGELILGGTPAAKRSLTLLKNTGYLAGYDEERKNPAWVAYKVFPARFPSSPRPDGFEADTRTRARVETSDYSNSGYDRGHMAPNRAIALCYGQEAQRETFLMSNVVPQKNGLNGTFWAALERRIMDRYTRRYDDVWVVCGPVYELGVRDQTLGSGVAIPREFFLIIADQTKDGGIRAEAFLIPHEDISASADPSDYLSSIRAIEVKTGLDFFSQFPAEAQNALETSAARRVW